MNFIPKVFCLFLAYSLLLTAAGCTRSGEPPITETSSATQSSEPEEFLPPAPAYAESNVLPEGYTLDTSGFDPVFTRLENHHKNLFAYRTDRSLSGRFHHLTNSSKIVPTSSPIIAVFSLDPTGTTDHPMMLFIAFPKDVAEQTGKLKIGEDTYNKEELSDYLVYSDSAYEIYQIQPLVCGQPFTDCWDQLIQYAGDMRKNKDCKWRDIPINMDYNKYILEAYTYFSEHVSELIVPPQANSVSSEINNPK